MALERGALLNNRYRIFDILGQGGMGSVYRAIDENLGIEVAVKENLFTTEEYSRQFRREASLLASLRHPNLPRVIDHFEIEDVGQYLVMDYVEGEDLRQRMDRDSKLPEDEVIVIGLAMCDALIYLHSRRPQVLHRDLKPGNVKITSDGRIFLVDFGLAKIVETSLDATTTGARAMTPGYSPPEQYGTARTDPRSDIYSLGATLYAALCAALPEDGLARAMEQAALTPVRKHNSKVSRKLAAVLEKALSVQPDARYQTAEEFKDALLAAANSLKRSLEELTVTPPPLVNEADLAAADAEITPRSALRFGGYSNGDPARLGSKPSPDYALNRPISRPIRQPRRLIRVAGIALLFFLLLFTGGTIAYTQLPGFPNQLLSLVAPVLPESILSALVSPTPEPSPTQTLLPPTQTPEPTVTPTIDPTFTLVPSPTVTQSPSPTETATSTPDPTIVPQVLGRGAGEIAFVSDRTGILQIWIVNVEGTRWRQLTSLPEGACQPTWSPDGQRIAFVSPCARRSDLYTFSGLFVINADGSGFTALLGRAAGDFDPDWSPDGSRIAFTSQRSTGKPQIYVLNLDDGSLEVLADEGSANMQPSWSPDGRKIIYVSTLRNGERLWMMNADGSEKVTLSDADSFASQPAWSPDGLTVYYAERDPNGASLPRLVFSSVDPFSKLRLFSDAAPRRDADVSPDGLWLVYESWPTGNNHDIYLFDLVNQKEKLLVGNPFYDMQPVWRPPLIVKP